MAITDIEDEEVLTGSVWQTVIDTVEDTSVGHDHDGVDSKLVGDTSVVGGSVVNFSTSQGHRHDGTDGRKVQAEDLDPATNVPDGTVGSESIEATAIKNVHISSTAAVVESKIDFSTSGHNHNGIDSAKPVHPYVTMGSIVSDTNYSTTSETYQLFGTYTIPALHTDMFTLGISGSVDIGWSAGGQTGAIALVLNGNAGALGYPTPNTEWIHLGFSDAGSFTRNLWFSGAQQVYWSTPGTIDTGTYYSPQILNTTGSITLKIYGRVQTAGQTVTVNGIHLNMLYLDL